MTKKGCGSYLVGLKRGACGSKNVLGKGVVWLKWVLAMCRVAKSFKGCGRNLAHCNVSWKRCS